MAIGIEERAGVDEQYQTASNTSNLKVESDRRGAGDVIIAAGWSPSRVGMALLRLHSEWDSAVKPRKPGRAAIDAKVAQYKAEDAVARSRCHKPNCEICAPARSPIDRAQAYFDQEMASDLRLLAVSLKARPIVWEQIGHWVALKGIAPSVAAEALLHWLNPVCPACDGLKLKKVPNSPALSARQCSKCHGTGERTRPADSTKVLNYIDDCCQKARQSLKSRLRNSN